MRTTRVSAFYTMALAILANLSLAGSVWAAPPGGMMHPGMNPDNPEQMMEYGQNYMGGGRGWMGSMMGGGYGWGGGFGMGMGTGCGYGPGGGFMGGRGPMMGYLYSLNLSKEQKQKMRDIRQKQREENLQLMNQMEDESDKLDDLYSQETPNPKEVGKVYDSIFSVQRKMIENHIRLRNSIYALLTDEQKQKLKKQEPFFGRRGMMMW